VSELVLNRIEWKVAIIKNYNDKSNYVCSVEASEFSPNMRLKVDEWKSFYSQNTHLFAKYKENE